MTKTIRRFNHVHVVYAPASRVWNTTFWSTTWGFTAIPFKTREQAQRAADYVRENDLLPALDK